jgi:hypothetical protein
MPADEIVQSAGARDQIAAWPEEQMVSVPENDFGPEILEVAVRDCLDGAARADRHEHRRLHDAVRRPQLPAAREAFAVGDGELKGAGSHGSIVADHVRAMSTVTRDRVHGRLRRKGQRDDAWPRINGSSRAQCDGPTGRRRRSVVSSSARAKPASREAAVTGAQRRPLLPVFFCT